MYLNAIFVINDVILEELYKVNHAKRLMFILGDDGIDNFAKQLIDMEDYYETTNLFYSVLTSKEFNFSELQSENMICLYDDCKHMGYCVENGQLWNIYKKISDMSETIITKAFSLCELSSGKKDMVSPLEKFKRLEELILEAICRSAHLLLVFQNEK
ncbi:hypothetical protein ACWG0P_01335 [Amedibacillus sp. YH-ame6]